MISQTQYSAARTLWKALLTFAVAIMGGSADLFAEVVTAGQIPETMDEFIARWPVLLVAFLLAAFRAYGNWRKHHDTRLVLPVLLVGVLAMPLLMGCTTNGAVFEARVIDPVTGYVDETRFTQRASATIGSKLAEGAGQMSYDWADGTGSINVGNAANGLEAGNGEAFIQGIAVLGQMLGPLIGAQAQRIQAPPPSNDGSVDWNAQAAVLMQQLMQILQARQATSSPP